jgi:hypothetical protein
MPCLFQTNLKKGETIYMSGMQYHGRQPFFVTNATAKAARRMTKAAKGYGTAHMVNHVIPKTDLATPI